MSVIPYYNILNSMLRDFVAYVSRVAADSGLIKSNDITRAYFNHLRNTGRQKPLACFIGDAGYKPRVSGIYQFATKLYSLFGLNDAAQTTANSQPYLIGNIAPTGKFGVKNNNGESRFLSHAPISFSATDKWTVEVVLNRNGKNNIVNERETIFGDGAAYIGLKFNENFIFRFYNGVTSTANGTASNANIIGKTSTLHFVANGNNTILCYIDGVLRDTLSGAASNIILSRILASSTSTDNVSSCSLYKYTITPAALSASQVASDHAWNKLNIIDANEVKIGTQRWALENCEMVATPMGNLIPNVTVDATWTTSQTLYDNTYAATSGTTEQKTYAALKAAAMWRYYNNDSALGSVYGKHYNGFAASLIEADIVLYNAANPTTPYGYGVPTQAELNTLATFVGDNSGKLKVAGATYVNSPNTGATNETGFTMLAGGVISDNTGASSEIGNLLRLWGTNGRLAASNTDTVIQTNDVSRRIGYNLRLIKR